MAEISPVPDGLAIAPNGAGDLNNPAATNQELQAHRYWGRWASAAVLPNASGNAATGAAYGAMRPGDEAYVEDIGLYVLNDRGTSGGADASWVRSPGAHGAIHLNIGKLSSSTTATTPVGTPDPAALAVFGQQTVGWSSTIEEIHLHVIEDLGVPGTMSLEVFWWRLSTGVHTLLGTLAWAGGSGNYGVITLVPAPTVLQPHDYLQAQLRTYVAGGGGDGITIDAHFVGED